MMRKNAKNAKNDKKKNGEKNHKKIDRKIAKWTPP